MSPTTRAELATSLRELPPQQIIELFYEAIAETNTETDRFVVMMFEKEDDGKWWGELVAPPSVRDTKRGLAPDGTFVAGGMCEGCDSGYWSWSSHPECPLCGRQLEGSEEQS